MLLFLYVVNVFAVVIVVVIVVVVVAAVVATVVTAFGVVFNSNSQQI